MTTEKTGTAPAPSPQKEEPKGGQPIYVTKTDLDAFAESLGKSLDGRFNGLMGHVNTLMKGSPRKPEPSGEKAQNPFRQGEAHDDVGEQDFQAQVKGWVGEAIQELTLQPIRERVAKAAGVPASSLLAMKAEELAVLEGKVSPPANGAAGAAKAGDKKPADSTSTFDGATGQTIGGGVEDWTKRDNMELAAKQVLESLNTKK